MSKIFNLDLFNAQKFEQFDNPTDSQLDECIVYGQLDDLTVSVKDGIVLETKSCGFIDAILSDLEEPFLEEDDANRSLLIKILNNLSENSGRLVNKFGQKDPFFYGYLTYNELQDLIKILTNFPGDPDREWIVEFKNTLLLIAERAVQKNLGLIYWALP